MKTIFLFAALMTLASCSFTTTNYPQFENMSNDEFSRTHLGLHTNFLQDTMLNMFLAEEAPDSVNDDLPDSFDWREEMGQCVHPVRDQGACGSCWAHGASEVLSDRFCIHSKGQIDVVLSPQQLVDCDLVEMGCSGGFLTTPFIYYSLVGGNTEDCYGEYVSGKTGARSKTCFLTKWSCKSYRAKLTSIKWLMNPAAIKKDIYTNGPVNTGFSVYEDFRNYQSGIYKHTTGELLGGHAVKIVGWGNDNGQEYWIVQNSWSAAWGQNGFFNIAFGECGIDSGATSVLPSV